MIHFRVLRARMRPQRTYDDVVPSVIRIPNMSVISVSLCHVRARYGPAVSEPHYPCRHVNSKGLSRKQHRYLICLTRSSVSTWIYRLHWEKTNFAKEFSICHRSLLLSIYHGIYSTTELYITCDKNHTLCYVIHQNVVFVLTIAIYYCYQFFRSWFITESDSDGFGNCTQ